MKKNFVLAHNPYIIHPDAGRMRSREGAGTIGRFEDGRQQPTIKPKQTFR